MESASFFVDSAVKIFNLLDESHKKRKGLTGGIDFIQKELQSIKEAIGKRSGTADQDGIRSWIAELRGIRQRIQNCVNHYNLKVTCEHEAGFVHDAYHHVKTFRSRNKLASEIEEIRKLVIEAKQRVDRYHPQQAGQTAIQNNRAPHHANEANPDGLEKPKTELVQLLTKGEGKANQLRVIAVAGMGGSGKTVLAKAAYKEVQQEFDCKAWVVASNGVDKLLGDILDELQVPRAQSSKDLSEQLREFLQNKNKRYIIGIDDLQTIVWWRDILYACPDGNKGSRIIVTTTNEQIARSCHKNCRVHKMQPLEQIPARALLKRKAFGEDGCPFNSDKGLDMMLEICEYLPLAIVNMADHMKRIKGWNNDNCEQACKGLRSLLTNTNNEAFAGMNQVLNRSYNSLNDQAMICLLSLSTYPKDHVIKRKSLIRRWLAERLVVATDNRREEDVANECFTALVDHNIILPTDFSISGQVKTFRVHRLMLEFVIDKSSSENFVTVINSIHDGSKENHGKINRLALDNSSTEPTKIGKKVDLSYALSLTFFGSASSALMDFSCYTLLLVLDLENCKNLQDDNLGTVCKLSMLTYLSIRGNDGVSNLPQKIVKLRRLETLDTRDTKVRTLPMEIINQLSELAHLFGEFHITCNPKTSSNKMSKLQTLSGFAVDESPGFVKTLSHMAKLSKVKIQCRKAAPSFEVLNDLLISLKECFEKEIPSPNLALRSVSIDFGTTCCLDFLDGLEVPSPFLLRSLKLRGKLTRLPKCITSDNLTELCLSGTNLGGSVLSVLQGLQNLEYLKLTEDSFKFEAEEFFEAENYIWESGWFVYLKRLCFVVPELPKIVIKENAMQGLESLQLFCTQFGGFSGIERLPRLEEVILGPEVTRAAADTLLRQVETHPMRPKFLKKQHPGQITKLARSSRIQRQRWVTDRPECLGRVTNEIEKISDSCSSSSPHNSAHCAAVD